MDGGAPTTKAGSGGKKAVLPVPAEMNDAGASAATTSARGARKATLPGAAACASTDVDAPAAATAAPGEESNGGGEEDDDEQVERFYALLDNIRAMRGAYGSGDGTGALDDGVVDTGGGGGARVKRRLRGSEPPWRPAFRLEDFEAPAPTSSSGVAAPRAKRTRGQEAEADGGEGSGGAGAGAGSALCDV